MLFKRSKYLVVRAICSRKRYCIWSEWPWFSEIDFFFGAGGRGTNLPAVSPIYLRNEYGGLQISILWVRAHCKVFKIHLDNWQLLGGNCSGNLVFYDFFAGNYSQNQSKYFAMTCFNQIQIMNFTKFIASHQYMDELCEIFDCVKYSS